MKCDDFLPYLETGGVGRQLLARCHAARCPRCGAVFDSWSRAKRHWATPEPLSPDVRRVWQQSADETVKIPPLRWRLLPATAGVAVAAAACVLMCAIAWTLWKTHRSPPGEIDPGSQPMQLADVSPVRELDTSAEFVSLETCLRELDIEIAALMPQAELLDAHLQAADILNRYSKW